MTETQTNSNTTMKPKAKPSDFQIIKEIGDGNFSRISTARHKDTGVIYAIKTIEKTTIERMKKRQHPNINKEILMEKRTLEKLAISSLVIDLFATFQDHNTLYYQMEFVDGGELWTFLKDRTFETPFSVGCFPSMIPFFVGEIINAVEFMHQHGIVHRDIKPENVLVTSTGHIKFIDFNTAKDLIETDLNGQEFVGTAEYFSPYTVRSKPVGIDADLWALGVLVYQLLTGYTPFHAPSPYLIFLRIERNNLQIPAVVDEISADFIKTLLQLDAFKRIESCIGNDSLTQRYSEEQSKTVPEDTQSKKPKKRGKSVSNALYPVQFMTKEWLHAISYNALRNHTFFDNFKRQLSVHQQICNLAATAPAAETTLTLNTLHQFPPVRVPSLRDLCIRAVGKAVTIAASIIAQHAGARPDDIPWVKCFNLNRLSVANRTQVAHYLNRCDRLYPPNHYQLFFPSLIDARLIHVTPVDREYIGYNYTKQGQWHKEFFFAMFSSPQLGFHQTGEDKEKAVTTEQNLRGLVTVINKVRPRFVIANGNFTHKAYGDEGYDDQIHLFRRNMARISESIPVLYVPGEKEFGSSPTTQTIIDYQKRFGADYYGFWYGGCRCVVINSPLMCHSESLPAEFAAQEAWLEEEIELSKLCSNHLMIFSHHPWFEVTLDEETSSRNIPMHIRSKWLKKLRHRKIKYVFVGGLDKNTVVRVHKNSPSQAAVPIDDHTEDEVNANKPNEKTKSEIEISTDPNEVVLPSTLAEPHEEDSESESIDEGNNNNSDNESNNGEAGEEEDTKPYENEDLEYTGPTMLSTRICLNEQTSTFTPGIRFIKVYEEDIKHQYYTLEEAPKSITV